MEANVALLLLVSLLAAWPAWYLWHSRQRLVRGKRLPPGSYGWPLLGETLGLLQSFRSGDFQAFAAHRRSKYGTQIFKTHVFGSPYVFVSGPEAARLMATSENKLVEAHQFLPARLMMGQEAMTSVSGAKHKVLRRSLEDKFRGDELRKYLKLVEEIALELLSGWRPGDVRSIKAEATKFTFNVMAGLLLSWGPGPERDRSQVLASHIAGAVIASPINLPGFAFHRGMQARRMLDEMVDRELKLRRSGQIVRDDLLTVLTTATDPYSDSTQPVLNDEKLKDNLQAFFFAGHESSTSCLTWIAKFLSENPRAYQHLVAEHEEIRSAKGEGAISLNWADLKKMTFTTKVIQEALRIGSIIFLHHRRVKEDFQLYGYDIPKGWNIILDPHELHHNAESYPDPQTFNPWRFDKPAKPYTYMPFGIGPRQCIAKDVAMMEMSVFLHHWVLKCKWSVIGKTTGREGVSLPSPKGGVPIKIHALNY